MIGIDIVDFTDPQLKIRSANDLRFISHPKDQLSLTDNDNLNYWMRWTIKEAAFKAHKNLNRFDPKQIYLQSIQTNTGEQIKAHVFSKIFLISLELTPVYSMALAYIEGYSPVHSVMQVADNLQAQKKAVRSGILKKMKELGISMESEELDNLFNPNISFSHHHKLGAFAFLPNSYK